MMVWTKEEGVVLPIMLIAIVLLSLFLSFLMRKKSDIIKRVPLIVLTAVVWLLEIVKQVLNIVSGYSLWAIPLHFCSLFLYFYPLASFFRGKVGEFGKTMCYVAGSLFVILFYFNPGSIIGSSCSNIFQDFSSFHTFTYHHIIILFYLTMLFSKLYRPSKKDFLYVAIGISGYAIIMIPLAHILNVNFCNILTSNIAFMEALRLNIGQVGYTVVMILIGIIGGELIVLISNLIYNLICNKKKDKDDKEFKKIIKIIKSEA